MYVFNVRFTRIFSTSKPFDTFISGTKNLIGISRRQDRRCFAGNIPIFVKRFITARVE